MRSLRSGAILCERRTDQLSLDYIDWVIRVFCISEANFTLARYDGMVHRPLWKTSCRTRSMKLSEEKNISEEQEQNHHEKHG